MRSYLVLMFNQVQVLVNFNARAKVDQPFIAYLSQILTLAKMHYLPNCQIKSCNKQVSVEKAVVGSALYLKWVCAEGHQSQQWCSQPVLNRGMHLGDLMLSS